MNEDLTKQLPDNAWQQILAGLDSINASLTTLESRMGSLEGRMGSLEGRMGSLEGRMGSLEGRMDSLEGRMDSLEGRMGSLEEQVEKRKYETKPIWERALKEIAETRLELRAGFEKIEGRFDFLEEKLEVLADDVITLRAKHKRLALRVRDIETAPAQ